MDCCPGTESTAVSTPDTAYARLPTMSRRVLLKGGLGAAGALALAACGIGGRGGGELVPLQLAFCSQLLCVVPYEVTRERGYFEEEGFDVELVYSQGGGAALQALVAGGVDYAATSFDAFVGAYSGGGEIRRFASTGRLPLFALATAPDTADEITELQDLLGRTVAVSALGNAEHTLLLYLLAEAGLDADEVEFATMGTNIYDALRVGQVDAGMVQEPALTLLQSDGGRVIANLMDIDDAEALLGGAYEFMGVAVRTDEIDERTEEMQGLARALAKGLEATRTAPVDELIDALPSELIVGEDREDLAATLDAYRESLYPSGVDIDTDAVDRAMASLETAGVLEEPLQIDELLDLETVGAT